VILAYRTQRRREKMGNGADTFKVGDTVRTCTGRIGKVFLNSKGKLMCEFHNGADTYHTTLSQYTDKEIELVSSPCQPIRGGGNWRG
jgi:preprotein translocase subunit YajC